MPTTTGLTLGFGSGVNIVENEGNAHYDGLQATFRATAWHNLTMGAAYTFSHAWDVIDAQLFNNVDNPMNPGYQYGTAGFDRRNIAVVNFDYNVPLFQNAHGLTKSLGGRLDNLRRGAHAIGKSAECQFRERQPGLRWRHHEPCGQNW